MSVKGRSPELRGIKPLIELSYIAAPRSFVGWHGKSLKLTKSRKFFITLVALLFNCHYHCSMWQKFNFVKKKIKTKICKRQKNLLKQCTVIPFTNKHWVSLYNVLEMIRSYPTRVWKQYLTHSPASGYVSLRSFVHSWRLSQIWKQRSHGNRIVRTAKWQQLQMQCVADGHSLIKVSIFYNQSMIHTL